MDIRTYEPDNYNDQRHRPNGVDLVQKSMTKIPSDFTWNSPVG